MGNVSRADENLAVTLKIMEEGDEVTPRIVVATSDHGEHLGENRLMRHRFSVRNAALHIPLIVMGLPGVRRAAGSASLEEARSRIGWLRTDDAQLSSLEPAHPGSTHDGRQTL